MYKQIIRKLPFQIDKIKKTDKGLTNDNYIVTIANKQYMLRYPLDDIKHLFNPANEKQVIKTILNESYVLPVKYYDQGIQLVAYIDDLKTFDNANKATRIKKVASLMQQFHNANLKVDFNFDPLKQIYLYKDNIKEKDIDLSIYDKVLTKLKNHMFEPVLCHNDWVEGNICFVDDKVYLIDFEYAGNNDRLFDVMSFLTENDLTNKERKQFLQTMFPSGITPKDYETLKMYRDINNLLWYLWALMMYEFRKDDIYIMIADIKYEQLTNEYDQQLWT